MITSSTGLWVGGRWVRGSVGKWSVVGWSVIGGSVVSGFNKTRVITSCITTAFIMEIIISL